MSSDLATEDLFDAAVRRLGGSRTFDVFGQPPPGVQTADWVFPERWHIVEHKHIEREYADSSKFRAGLLELQTAYDAGPRAAADLAAFGRGVLHLFEPAFADLFKKANRQIKGTRRIAEWPDAPGVLVIANRNLLALPPKHIMFVLRQLLERPQWSGIDAVIYQTDHFVGGAPDDLDLAVWASACRKSCPETLRAFVDELGRAHAEVLKVAVGPFASHVETGDKAALDGLTARR